MFACSLEEPRLLSLRGAREGLVARAWITKPRPTMLGRLSFAKHFFAKCCCVTFHESVLSRKFLVIRYIIYVLLFTVVSLNELSVRYFLIR